MAEMEVDAKEKTFLKPGPDFICFGLQKAGTQWLYDQMNSCSQVWMTPVKELNYFLGDAHKVSNLKALNAFHSRSKEGQFSDTASEGFFSIFAKGKSSNVEWYRSLFSFKGEKLSGDISPFYATADSADVKRIYATCPEARYIFLLRHPVDRIWSALCMHARKGRIEKDDLEDWRSVKTVISYKGYMKHSRPTEIWKRWTTFIPANSIRYWFLDDIISDPERVRHEISSFAGLDNPEFSIPANYNKKSSRQKFAMPDDVRKGLNETFGQEVEQCANLFGGASLNWK